MADATTASTDLRFHQRAEPGGPQSNVDRNFRSHVRPAMGHLLIDARFTSRPAINQDTLLRF